MSGAPAVSWLIPVMMGCGGLLLLVMVLASFFFARQTVIDADRALESARIESRMLRVMLLIQDAETNQRGYLLTGRDAYLGPFERTKRLVDMQVLSVRPDLEALGIDGATLERLQDLVVLKMTELEQTIELKRQGRDTEALTLMRSDVGTRYIEEISQISTRIGAFTENAGFVRIANLRQGSDRLILMIALAAGLVLVLAVGTTILFARGSAQLRVAHEDLRLANETLEETVAYRTQHLRRANREIQNFAYVVSHDLRAPLVNIMGFTAELERAAEVFGTFMKAVEQGRPEEQAKQARIALDEDMPEALHFIRSSMDRMDDLIKTILVLARVGTRQLVPEPVDLENLCHELADSLRHRLDAVGGKIFISPALPQLMSDRLAISQILGNLFDNAVKYADPSRELVIEVGAIKIGERISIHVSDNGRGIAPQDHERIFELFRRSGPQTITGEGIGLTHVRALSRRLGGDTTVASGLGEGAQFTVWIAADLRRVGEERET